MYRASPLSRPCLGYDPFWDWLGQEGDLPGVALFLVYLWNYHGRWSDVAEALGVSERSVERYLAQIREET